MLLAQLLSFSALAAALPAAKEASGCTNPPTRKEWRQLSDDERTAYGKAVQCLTTKDSRIGLNTTLYDDFAHTYQKLDNQTHLVGGFLPWHRYFVHVYEKALQDCGYKGNAVYWDWTQDYEDPVKATIWDSEAGVGGNGNSDKTEKHGKDSYNCVTDGLFSELKPAYNGDEYEPHCVHRNFNNGTDFPGDMFRAEYSPKSIDTIQKVPSYQEYRVELESGPNAAILSAMGGDMATATAPNDPLFFLHIAQIDRLWWMWQQWNTEKRYKEYSGIKSQDEDSRQVSLDDKMVMLGMADDIKVSEVMETQNDLLCYQYM